MPHMRADSCKFVTAGREDIDVRMLGRGRPFILEIFNPRNEMPGVEFWQQQAERLADAGEGVSRAPCELKQPPRHSHHPHSL
jgi:tRNA pseudouridine synthase 10